MAKLTYSIKSKTLKAIKEKLSVEVKLTQFKIRELQKNLFSTSESMKTLLDYKISQNILGYAELAELKVQKFFLAGINEVLRVKALETNAFNSQIKELKQQLLRLTKKEEKISSLLNTNIEYQRYAQEIIEQGA